MSFLYNKFDALLARFNLRLTHRRWMPKGTDAFLYGKSLSEARSSSFGRPIILDIGANEGQTALAFRQSVPDAVIHSFELVPSTYRQLARNVSQRKGHFCYCYGISNECKTFKIRLAESSLGNRIENRAEPDSTETRLETVQVRTVDEVVSDLRLECISILKSDTEGHELAVLQGAQNTLKSGKVGALMIETTFPGLSNIHTSLDKLVDFLSPFGYQLTGVCDLNFRKTGVMKFCNAIFLRQGTSYADGNSDQQMLAP